LNISKLANTLSKGLVIDLIVAAFFYIKPLHIVGLAASNEDIAKYWLRQVPKNHLPAVKYFWNNYKIINDINKRKVRLNNSHILTSFLCGSFVRWMKIE